MKNLFTIFISFLLLITVCTTSASAGEVSAKPLDSNEKILLINPDQPKIDYIVAGEPGDFGIAMAYTILIVLGVLAIAN